MKKNLINEYDLLESIIVHRPGLEHHFMTPKNLNSENIDTYLLFDDILFPEKALEEHFFFTFIIEQITGKNNCFELIDLLEEVLSDKNVKNKFISDIAEIHNKPELESLLKEEDDLITFILAGFPSLELPLPNIMFTRDLAVSIGNSMIITWASNQVRNPENIIAKHIIKNHKLFSNCNIYDFHKHHPNLALEGGDVTLINEEVIAIGISERTSKESVEAITPFLYENGIRYILCFKMPEERTFMHLDTIFSIINTNEAIVFPPFFEKGSSKELDVDIILASKNGPASISTLKINNAFQKLNIEFNYIKCGGKFEFWQKREQWTDGANAFCLSPGKIILYDRNMRTLKELEKHGYKIIDGNDLTLKKLDKNQKVAITIESGELSRGRGGPRCLTMPINRIK